VLLTWNNSWYYQDLMRGLREAIRDGRLADYAERFTAEQATGDIAPLAA
jgi:queuine tRNA-ribosyltransferase